MIQSAEEFVALRTDDDPEKYKRAIYEPAASEVWLEVIGKYPHMKVWVVLNKTVPENILELLANDDDSIVREAIARKRKISHKLLQKLANDSHESVRLAVAANKSTPLSILRMLAQDSWEPISETVRERLK